ncbi:MAG: hypothetical protein WCW67_01785 [Candidatus Margulisiibacteriota bacterium]|jgi:hypothetical protein
MDKYDHYINRLKKEPHRPDFDRLYRQIEAKRTRSLFFKQFAVPLGIVAAIFLLAWPAARYFDQSSERGDLLSFVIQDDSSNRPELDNFIFEN